MAFPASQVALEKARENISSIASRVKIQTQDLIDQAIAGDVSRLDFVVLQKQLQHAIDVWDANAAIPGLPQYMRDQYDDQTLDIVAEAMAMRSEAVTLRNLIFTALDGVLLQTLLSDGNFAPINITAPQKTGFITAANTFTATIS